MERQKKITIAIPTLNAASTLGSTLESLSSLRDIAHVVLIDSLSTDATLEIANLHSVEILQCSPGNMYAAINLGLKRATTPWLTYINADDLIYPETLRARLLDLPEDVSVSYGTVDFIDAEGRFLRSWRPASSEAVVKLYRAGYSPMLQQGTLFRVSLYQELGGFDEQYKYVSDADFWFRALRSGAIVYRYPKLSVAAFRIHQGQITQRLKKQMLAEHIQMVQKCSGEPKPRQAVIELFFWRLENSTSYLERWLRAFRLGLRPLFCGSYELH